MKHDLVMQGPAEQRMRMANYGGVRGSARACIQQSFEPARRSVDKQRANCRVRRHRLSLHAATNHFGLQIMTIVVENNSGYRDQGSGTWALLFSPAWTQSRSPDN